MTFAFITHCTGFCIDQPADCRGVTPWAPHFRARGSLANQGAPTEGRPYNLTDYDQFPPVVPWRVQAVELDGESTVMLVQRFPASLEFLKHDCTENKPV